MRAKLLQELLPLDLALLAATAALWLTPDLLPAAGFATLAILGWRRRGWGRARLARGLQALIVVLLVLGLAALLVSSDLEDSLPRLLGLCIGGAVSMLVLDVLSSEKRIWLVVAVLGVAGMVVAGLGLLGTDWARADQILPWPSARTWLPPSILPLPGSDSGGLHPNKLAAAVAMLLPLPAAVMLYTPGRLSRLFWGLGTALMTGVLLLTQSRSGLIAASVALLVLAVTRWRRAWIVVPILVVGLVGVTSFVGPDRVTEAVLALQLDDRGPPLVANRLGLWQRATELIRAHPLFGIGIGTFEDVLRRQPLMIGGRPAEAPHAHNLYLQIALDLGIPGLVVFLALIAAALRLTAYTLRHGPTARTRGLIAGAACGLLAYLAYGLTDAIGPGEKPGVFFWLLLGTVTAGAEVSRQVARAAQVGGAAGRGPDPAPVGSVIYVSTFEWDYHTARPQQLARALAERVPVLYVETTGLRGVGARDLPRLFRRIRRGLAGRHRVQHGIWVFSPLVLPLHRSRLARALNRVLLRDAVRGQADDLGLRHRLLLISIPTAASLDLVGHLGEVASIYDCMDDLTVIPMVDPSVAETEAELARRVDVMVCASEQLARSRASLREDIAVVGQGVELEHFAAPAGCPTELAELPRPRLVCVGGIDERIDFDLLDELARSRPDWSIVLVGPNLYLRASDRVNRPNVRLIGRRSYAELPAYLQAADVCLIPYRDTPWARACNPVKTLEYLAAGRPVVSTDLPAVHGYRPLVRVARGGGEFMAAVEAALAEDDALMGQARRAVAAGASWRSQADRLYALASAAAARDARPVAWAVD